MQPQSNKLLGELQAAITKIINSYDKASSDGKLTFSEIWGLFQNALATLIQLTEKYAEYTGEQKKEVVLAALDQLFDRVIKPIDIKGVPNFLEPIVDKALKQLLMTLAGPAIDSLVNIFNKTGWGGGQTAPKPTPEPGLPDAPPGDVPEDFEPY